MLDRQAKARNPNAPRTHSPRKPIAIRPRRVAILSDCIAFIPIQRRPDAFEQNLSVAEIFHCNADLSAALGISADLTVERGESCLSDLYVVLGSIEARADAADDLAIDHDRQPPLHFDIAVRRHCRDPPVIDGILQCLARLFEERGGSFPTASEFPAGAKGRVIHSHYTNRPPALNG